MKTTPSDCARAVLRLHVGIARASAPSYRPRSGPLLFYLRCLYMTLDLDSAITAYLSQQSLYLSPLILSWHSSFPVDPSAYPNKPHVITWSTPLRGIKWISGECSASPSSIPLPPLTLHHSASSHSCSPFLSISFSFSAILLQKLFSFKNVKIQNGDLAPSPCLCSGSWVRVFTYTHAFSTFTFPQLHPTLTCWKQSWFLESTCHTSNHGHKLWEKSFKGKNVNLLCRLC